MCAICINESYVSDDWVMSHMNEWWHTWMMALDALQHGTPPLQHCSHIWAACHSDDVWIESCHSYVTYEGVMSCHTCVTNEWVIHEWRCSTPSNIARDTYVANEWVAHEWVAHESRCWKPSNVSRNKSNSASWSVDIAVCTNRTRHLTSHVWDKWDMSRISGSRYA